jgi:hypothetical protein
MERLRSHRRRVRRTVSCNGVAASRAAAVIGVLLPAATLVLPLSGIAQERDLRGYYLNVATGSAEGAFSPSGVSDFQRLRIMTSPAFGPVETDVAYEHSLSLVSDSELGFLPSLGEIETGTDWIPLQGSISEGDHAEWRHGVDRLLVSVPLDGDVQLDIGRQPISWATTLFLTPADPFTPFDPADPFREYRGGVDAARLQGYLGPFTGVEAVLRLADTRDGTAITALGRAHGAAGPWELSAWGGVVHDEASAAAGATLTTAGTAFRGEFVLRDPKEGDAVVRFATGVDRYFTVDGRTLYLSAEFQHDGLGAAGADEIVAVVLSDPFARGEMQVLGKDEAAVQAFYQVHPLVGVEILWLWNMSDRSALLLPAVSYSVSDEVSARAGVFVGLGSEESAQGLPGSEYGTVPTSLYVSLTAFF